MIMESILYHILRSSKLRCFHYLSQQPPLQAVVVDFERYSSACRNGDYKRLFVRFCLLGAWAFTPHIKKTAKWNNIIAILIMIRDVVRVSHD